jgi:hypothetical protein
MFARDALRCGGGLPLRGALTGLLVATCWSPAQAQNAHATSEEADIARKAEVRITPRCLPSAAASEEIVVCGSRSEAARQRLPRIVSDRFDPNGMVDSVSRERHRMYEVGDSGIGSCSTSGPGGTEGCSWKRFKERLEQHGK